MSDPRNFRTAGMVLLDECRTIMAGFDSTYLAHCPREANRAADLIASSLDECNFWVDDPPKFLYP